MRVLLVTGEFPPSVGGVGDYTDRLAAALTSDGHEIGVLTSMGVPRAVDEQNADAVWAMQPDAPIWREVRRWTLTAWRTLAQRVRAFRPDIVHLQYQAAAYDLRGAVALYPWLLRSWSIRPQVVATFHDLLTPHPFPLSGRLGVDAAALRVLARGCDAVIATSEDDAAGLRRLRVRQVHQVPIGPNIIPGDDPYDRVAWRRRLGIDEDGLLLAYFGFYNASKGLEDLFGAVARLRDRLPNLRLLLIGGGVGQTDRTNAAFARQLQSLASELGLEDIIIPTGYETASSVSADLRAADLVVLPFRDGASLRRGTLMAALAHGCAIVTTKATTLVPDLADGAVQMAPAGDVPALAIAIEQALGPTSAMQLRAAAAALAARFSWPRIAKAHSVIYDSLCHSY